MAFLAANTRYSGLMWGHGRQNQITTHFFVYRTADTHKGLEGRVTFTVRSPRLTSDFRAGDIFQAESFHCLDREIGWH